MIALRSLLARTPANASARCATCAHFDNRAQAVEAALPGLRSFGSAQSAVRTTDGICTLNGRYLSAGRTCREHTPARR